MANPTSRGDQFLSNIHKIIEDNLDNENFSVEDLALHAGLSRSMLHRKLIKITGKPAKDLIIEKRLFRAKELLENDVATVSEIAYKVGFNSPSYFTKVFKDHFHVSPGEVRKGFLPEQPVSEIRYIARHFNLKSGRTRILASVISFIILITAAVIFQQGIRKGKLKEKSIAILPFDDLSSDGGSQYFADGIVEDLLNRISQIEKLKVISRTSSEMFRDKGSKTIPEIAKILDVGYILEGTVQRESDNIRINIQLIDAPNDEHVLSKQYDRKLSEVFKIQSEIAGQIASELSIALTDRQLYALKQNRTINLKALEYYQMGRFHSSKRWIDGYRMGLEYYEKAIAEDSEYGLAYAGLSDVYHLMALQHWMDGTEGQNKAIDLARKALKLDPGLAEPHAVLGDLYTYSEWNWQKGEDEFLQAIKLNSNYSTAHQYYSELLYITGRYDKAREHINKALDLDPFSFIIRYISSLFYYNQKQFNEALAENKVCQELVKDHMWAVRLEFDILYQLGLEQEAVESFRRFGKLFNHYNPSITDSVYQNEGLEGLLRVKIRTETDQTKVACWHALLGEYETAMDSLESLFLKRNLDQMDFFRFEFQKMNDNPRYINLCERMNLPNYQVQPRIE